MILMIFDFGSFVSEMAVIGWRLVKVAIDYSQANTKIPKRLKEKME